MDLIVKMIHTNNLFTVIIIIVMVLTIYLVGHMYKFINSKLDRTLETIANLRKDKRSNFIKIKVKNKKLNNFYDKCELKLLQAGEKRRSLVIGYIIFGYIFPFILAIYLVFKRNYIGAVLIAILIKGIIETYLNSEIKKHENMFQKEAYKIYKFYNNQISSGISVNVAINNLYKAVNDKILKSRLLKMASVYSSTNDIDSATKYITDYYKTYEARSLAIVIRQGVNTGQNDFTIDQKEKKLFSKYINIIRIETEKNKMKMIGIAMLFLFIIIVITCYPLIKELAASKQQIFYR
ncbi:hypothetical protein SH1V18_47810 [Vallitalea longa]|uniref:Uncharacterized protein n=1 Tax=Vallitalea longa TaxID=2936439 RepID=A0A9W5YGM0_9FIRM|nr:hypothetical protein [Vallitalea longa]GKX32301.1 hypothetical protein SH1V18_47810 [Vallitalea longa]